MGFRRCDAAHLFKLVFGGGEADFEAVDLAGPTPFVCFGDAVGQADAYFLESWLLVRVDSQQWAADAGVLVVAGGGVGAAAGAEFDFAVFEVVEELVPFGVGDVAIFVAGSLLAAAGNEGAVVSITSWS